MLTEGERKQVDNAVNQLMEHFDSVRIFVTKHDGERDSTFCYNVGAGNFYAQLGQINEWRTRQDQFARKDTAEANEE